MTAHNDVTGDSLVTKAATDKYRDGWDRIFGKNKLSEKDVEDAKQIDDTGKIEDE
jgi:hypothetical protein